MKIFRKIEELEFEQGILKGENYNFNDLDEVVIAEKMNTDRFETILTFAWLISFFLGFFTLGIAWLYIGWRIKVKIENMNKSYLVLTFKEPFMPDNIIEKRNDLYVGKRLVLYKDDRNTILNKYSQLKMIVSSSSINKQVIFSTVEEI